MRISLSILPIALGSCVIGAAIARSIPSSQESVEAIAKEQLVLSKTAIEAWRVMAKIGTEPVDLTPFYLWSDRRVNAQRRSGGSKAELVAILQDHLKELEKMAAELKQLRDLGMRGGNDLPEIQFRVLEAKMWLAEAQAG